MNTHISIHERLRRHERDVTLLGRLFADWSRGHQQRRVEADRRLDEIEAQLARLEQTVRMTAPPVRTASPVGSRHVVSRTAIPLALQQS